MTTRWLLALPLLASVAACERGHAADAAPAKPAGTSAFILTEEQRARIHT
jgi:hypothetical protein